MALSKERILKRSVCYEIGPVFYQTKGAVLLQAPLCLIIVVRFVLFLFLKQKICGKERSQRLTF